MTTEETNTVTQAEPRKKRFVVELPEDLLQQVKAADQEFWGGEPVSNSGLVEKALRRELVRLNDMNQQLNDRDEYHRFLYYEERDRMRNLGSRRRGKKNSNDDLPF